MAYEIISFLEFILKYRVLYLAYRSSTKVQEDTLPPSDSVLKFLLQLDEASRTPCANCDGVNKFFPALHNFCYWNLTRIILTFNLI